MPPPSMQEDVHRAASIEQVLGFGLFNMADDSYELASEGNVEAAKEGTGIVVNEPADNSKCAIGVVVNGVGNADGSGIVVDEVEDIGDGEAGGGGIVIDGRDGVGQASVQVKYVCWDKECGMTFDSDSKKRQHYRDVHQASLVCKLKSGVSVRVPRKEDAKFHCPILECPFSNKYTTNFGRHVKTHLACSALKEGFSTNDNPGSDIQVSRLEQKCRGVSTVLANHYREKTDNELPQLSQLANIRALVGSLGDSTRAACAMLQGEEDSNLPGYLQELACTYMENIQMKIRSLPIHSSQRIVNGNGNNTDKKFHTILSSTIVG